MDEQLRAAALGELAMQAGIERASFLTDAARQFEAFMDENGDRIRELGGLVLIDDEPEYLAVAADGTFRLSDALPGRGGRVGGRDGGHRERR